MFTALAFFAAVEMSPITGPASIHEFTVIDIEGKKAPLARYKGKVLLVVNVASKCGNTPQYKGLQALYTANKGRGFEVLGFPANDFRGQEPGTDAEIKAFCTLNYGVTFPMFSKVEVTGERTHPLFKWLVAESGRPEPVEWNFTKFLVGKNGRVVARFAPKTQPDAPEIKAAIDAALKA